MNLAVYCLHCRVSLRPNAFFRHPCLACDLDSLMQGTSEADQPQVDQVLAGPEAYPRHHRSH